MSRALRYYIFNNLNLDLDALDRLPLGTKMGALLGQILHLYKKTGSSDRVTVHIPQLIMEERAGELLGKAQSQMAWGNMSHNPKEADRLLGSMMARVLGITTPGLADTIEEFELYGKQAKARMALFKSIRSIVANPSYNIFSNYTMGGMFLLDALFGFHTFSDPDTPLAAKITYGMALTCSTAETGLYYLGQAGKVGYPLMRAGIRIGVVSAPLFALSQSVATFMDKEAGNWEKGASVCHVLGSAMSSVGTITTSIGCLGGLLNIGGIVLTLGSAYAQAKFKEERQIQ